MNFLFYAPQMAAYGGMERHLCTLAAAAAAKGHRVRFLTTSNSLGQELRDLMASPNIELRELQVGRGKASARAKALWLLRQIFAARFTRWHTIYTSGQSGLASWLWHAGNSRTRIVHHHHTAADAGEQAGWSPAFRKVLLKAPHLAGCSRATCEAINAAVERARPAQFLPYLTRCVMPATAVRERPAATPLRLGFLGRLVREKGIDTLLKLSTHPGLSDVCWEIHGAGLAYPPEYFSKYPTIEYKGAYHSADNHRIILKNLDAVVLFSTHNEGMPLSLIETMSAGVPWIATDRGGTRELALSSADCLVLQPGLDADELYAPLRAFLDTIKSGQTSRLRQRAAYDSFLEPERVAAQWLDFLCGPNTENPAS